MAAPRNSSQVQHSRKTIAASKQPISLVNLLPAYLDSNLLGRTASYQPCQVSMHHYHLDSETGRKQIQYSNTTCMVSWRATGINAGGGAGSTGKTIGCDRVGGGGTAQQASRRPLAPMMQGSHAHPSFPSPSAALCWVVLVSGYADGGILQCDVSKDAC